MQAARLPRTRARRTFFVGGNRGVEKRTIVSRDVAFDSRLGAFGFSRRRPSLRGDSRAMRAATFATIRRCGCRTPAERLRSICVHWLHRGRAVFFLGFPICRDISGSFDIEIRRLCRQPTSVRIGPSDRGGVVPLIQFLEFGRHSVKATTHEMPTRAWGTIRRACPDNATFIFLTWPNILCLLLPPLFRFQRLIVTSASFQVQKV